MRIGALSAGAQNRWWRVGGPAVRAGVLRYRCSSAESCDGCDHAPVRRVRDGVGAVVEFADRGVDAPCHLVFETADAFVSAENRAALTALAKPGDRIDAFNGYLHSAWTVEQANTVIGRSIDVVGSHIGASEARP